jgi:hypothetical protein
LRAAELATPVTPLGLVGLAPGWLRVRAPRSGEVAVPRRA